MLHNVEAFVCARTHLSYIEYSSIKREMASRSDTALEANLCFSCIIIITVAIKRRTESARHFIAISIRH